MFDTDPFRLDREIARVADAQQRWCRRLRLGDLTARLDPALSPATSTTALRKSLTHHDEDLGRALHRWVYRLAERRFLADSHVAVEREFRGRRHAITQPERVELSLSEIMERVLREAPAREHWFETYMGHADRLADAVDGFWARRRRWVQECEVVPPNVGVQDPKVQEAAQRFLADSADAFQSLSLHSPSGLLTAALAPHAQEGWPGRMTHRTVVELVGQPALLRGLDLTPWDLPARLCPASYLRALAGFGAAYCDAAAPQNVPFVLAHDPYRLRCHTWGALFGMLPTLTEFFQRRLGLSRSQARSQVRSVAVAVLIEARATAHRVLLGGAVLEGKRTLGEAFEGLSQRTLGLRLPPALGGALWRVRADEGQRLSGLLLAGAWHRRLRESHDEDWFRNPRAVEQLRAEAQQVPETNATAEQLVEGAGILSRVLAEQLE